MKAISIISNFNKGDKTTNLNLTKFECQIWEEGTGERLRLENIENGSIILKNLRCQDTVEIWSANP